MIKNKKLKKLYEIFLADATTDKTVGSPKKKFSQLNSYIDHTLLKPDATTNQIKVLCNEAREYSFKTVCVQPIYIQDCVRFLKNSDVLPITVIGFPLGANTIESKVYEAKDAIKKGAKEIDMVWNISALKSAKFDYVYDEVCAVVEACQKVPVKVIVETSLLSQKEKIFACACIQLANAEFIKTSTGFSQGGADVNDVLLFKKLLGSSVKIKASGGIKTTETAKLFLRSGADRLGTSSGVDIIKNTAMKPSKGSY